MVLTGFLVTLFLIAVLGKGGKCSLPAICFKDRCYSKLGTKSIVLLPGQKLIAKDDSSYLMIQKDGGLVIYCTSGRTIWEDQFQGNGILRIFNRLGKSVFSTSSKQKVGITLILQNDNNLVIYSASHKALWASGTDGKCKKD